MKISCEIIKDLLPLYAEKMTSEDSNLMIEEHLGNCPQCSEVLEEIKSNVKAIDAENPQVVPIRYVKGCLKKRKRTTVILACLCVFLLVFAIFSYISRPQYVSYEDSGVTVTENGDQVYIDFGANVSSCKVLKGQSIEGKGMTYEIEAWTSTLDKILGTSTPTLTLQKVAPNKDTVYYCNYSGKIKNNHTENTRIIYGVNPTPNGGMVVLPRLVLRTYFMLALISILVIGVAWALLRNKGKLSKVLKFVFFIPVSYVISNLPLLFSTQLVTYDSTRDFAINVIGAATIYGIIISGWSLFSQHKQDSAS